MSGRIQRASNLIPGRKAGGSPATVSQTVTVPRYPGGTDDVGTGKTLEFADDASVLVSLFTNFLGAVLQTIQAEVGPIATHKLDPSTWVAGSADLKGLLDQISLATSAAPGKLVGIKRWSLTSTAWSGERNLTVDTGYLPTGTPSLVGIWCYTVKGSRTLAEMNTGPTSVRGYGATVPANQVFIRLWACKTGTGE